MKRFIALFLFLVTALSTLSLLSGCGKHDDGLEYGQWLGMINNAFGMESYADETPHINTVSSNDQYFKTVQIAAEWDIIDNKDTFNPHNLLKWKDALITLVNAGSFLSSDADPDDKIFYAINHFDTSIRDYWMERTIDVESASKLLVVAQEQWANKTYDTPVESIKYIDGVIDLSRIENNGSFSFNPLDGIIEIKSVEGVEINKGDVFILPANNGSMEQIACKAEDIVQDNGITYVKTSKNLELGDFVDELHVEGTCIPDLSTAEIYDGNGNLIQGGSDSDVIPQTFYYNHNNDFEIKNMVYSYNQPLNIVNCAQKTTFSFEYDECKVEVTIKRDGLSAKIEAPFSETINGYYETEVSDFKITNKIDYSWFTLHSAEVKVDYKVKNSVGIKKTFVKKEATYAPKWSNGNGKFLTNLKNSVWKNKESGVGAKTIKLGSIKVASIGIASFSIDVYAKIKVDGSIEISCTETGCKGIEYKNGKCRVINTSDKDTDVKIKCKAEATVSIGPTVNAFGFAIIGLKAEVGLGTKASVTLHLADSENHLLEETKSVDIPPEVYESTDIIGLSADVEEVRKLAESQGGKYEIESSSPVALHIDTCIDINIYFILKVGLEEETLAGKLLKGTKLKIEWEICNSENAKILNLHVENFDFAKAFSNIKFFTDEDQCTMKYVPFEGSEKLDEETSSEENTNSSVAVGEVLTISTIRVTLIPESSTVLSVTQVPKGYELKDMIYKSKNPNVATVDKNGVIRAVAEGSTTVVVSTHDGKYSCACAVVVVPEKSIDFTPLNFTSTLDREAIAA